MEKPGRFRAPSTPSRDSSASCAPRRPGRLPSSTATPPCHPSHPHRHVHRLRCPALDHRPRDRQVLPRPATRHRPGRSPRSRAVPSMGITPERFLPGRAARIASACRRRRSGSRSACRQTPAIPHHRTWPAPCRHLGADAPPQGAPSHSATALPATPFGDALLAGPPAACAISPFRRRDEAACSSSYAAIWSAAALGARRCARTPPGAADLPSRSPSPRWLQPPGLPWVPEGADPAPGGVHLILRGTPSRSASGPPHAHPARSPDVLPPARHPARHAGCAAQRRQHDRGQHARLPRPLPSPDPRADGDAGEFRWGRERKLAMLA